MKKLFFLAIILFSFTGNIFSQTKPKPKTKVAIKPNASTPSFPPAVEYENGVKIASKGFRIAKAYLFKDTVKLSDNEAVKIGDKVNLYIEIDSGWTLKNGKVFPGASEVIALSSGQKVLDSKDLFAAYSTTGVSLDDAKYVSLSATITKLDDLKQYAVVTFRVWDKSGKSELKGSFKFNLKE